MFFFKEHLEPKDLADKDLAQVLRAFEVSDYSKPGQFKPLLNGLWPDSHKGFDEKFEKYLKQSGEFASVGLYSYYRGYEHI